MNAEMLVYSVILIPLAHLRSQNVRQELGEEAFDRYCLAEAYVTLERNVEKLNFKRDSGYFWLR